MVKGKEKEPVVWEDPKATSWFCDLQEWIAEVSKAVIFTAMVSHHERAQMKISNREGGREGSRGEQSF